jgi:hypothetical protein
MQEDPEWICMRLQMYLALFSLMFLLNRPLSVQLMQGKPIQHVIQACLGTDLSEVSPIIRNL